jgi:hypothetical protein
MIVFSKDLLLFLQNRNTQYFGFTRDEATHLALPREPASWHTGQVSLVTRLPKRGESM